MSDLKNNEHCLHGPDKQIPRKVYLESGEEVLLCETLSDKKGYIIKRLSRKVENKQVYEYASNLSERVYKIFDTPPSFEHRTETLNALQYLRLVYSKIDDALITEFKLKEEIKELKATKTNLSNMIVNYSDYANAKLIVVFSGLKMYKFSTEKGETPYELYFVINNEGDSKVRTEIKIRDGINIEYTITDKDTILINPNEDEINQVWKEVIKDYKEEIKPWELNKIPDEVLTKDLLCKKYDYKKKVVEHCIKDKKAVIKMVSKDIVGLTKELVKINSIILDSTTLNTENNE